MKRPFKICHEFVDFIPKDREEGREWRAGERSCDAGNGDQGLREALETDRLEMPKLHTGGKTR